MKIIPSLCLACGLASAQTAPDARAMLKETADVLVHCKSYVIDQRTVVDMKGGTQSRIEMSVRMAASNPGKMRIESSGQLGNMMIVSDGEHTWMYLGQLNQYTKTAAASSPEALVKSLVPGMGDMIDKLKAKDPYLSAKITGEEAVEVDGQKIDCYVVEANLDKIAMPGSMNMKDGVQKLWIDKASRLTLKQTLTAAIDGGPLSAPMQMNQAVTVVSEKLNEPVPDSLFTFTPPEGAKEVPEFKGPVRANADLTGRVAADFKLKAIDGKEYGLQDLHGRVVLLDFWATWCLPCRRELSVFEKLHREFNGKGLVVLGFDVGEDRDTVSKFLLASKLSYPIVLTAGTETPQNYGVNAYPTVVLIDQEGKIVAYHVGTGSEDLLRENLAKLGLESIPSKSRPE